MSVIAYSLRVRGFNPKYDGIKELYESGVETRALAARWGVTMSDMYSALKRRNTKFRKIWHPPPNPSYQGIIELYNKGFSTRACAEYFGLSKSAVWAALKRLSIKTRPQKHCGADNNLYRGGSRVSLSAVSLVSQALRKGLLVRLPCEVCGAVKSGKRSVFAHHDDYNKPLEVRWLCMKHHMEWHRHHKAVPLKKS